MVLLIATVTIGLWLAVVGVTTGVVVLLARVLDAIDLAFDGGGDDRGGGEPDWWPEFESELADYIASRG